MNPVQDHWLKKLLRLRYLTTAVPESIHPWSFIIAGDKEDATFRQVQAHLVAARLLEIGCDPHAWRATVVWDQDDIDEPKFVAELTWKDPDAAVAPVVAVTAAPVVVAAPVVAHVAKGGRQMSIGTDEVPPPPRATPHRDRSGLSRRRRSDQPRRRAGGDLMAQRRLDPHTQAAIDRMDPSLDLNRRDLLSLCAALSDCTDWVEHWHEDPRNVTVVAPAFFVAILQGHGVDTDDETWASICAAIGNLCIAIGRSYSDPSAPKHKAAEAAPSLFERLEGDVTED